MAEMLKLGSESMLHFTLSYHKTDAGELDFPNQLGQKNAKLYRLMRPSSENLNFNRERKR